MLERIQSLFYAELAVMNSAHPGIGKDIVPQNAGSSRGINTTISINFISESNPSNRG